MKLIDLKLWVPETVEEARQVVPDIDEEQFRKWQEDGAVELRLVGVYDVPPLAVIRKDRTYIAEQLLEHCPKRSRVVGVRLVYSDKSTFYTLLPVLECELQHATRISLLVDTLVKTLREYTILLDLDDLRRKITLDVVHTLLRYGTCKISLDGDEHSEVREIVLDLVGESTYYVLEPDRSYILKLQKVKVPRDLLPADVQFRSSFHRAGWIGRVSNTDPGFEGHIYVLLAPALNAPRLVLEKGARVVQVRFYKLAEPLKGYVGQWQGK